MRPRLKTLPTLLLAALAGCKPKHPPSDTPVPKAPDSLQVAAARMKDGDVPGALRTLDAAIAAAPAGPEAHLLRAKIRDAEGDYAGALQDLDRALELEPGRPETLYSRAAIRRRLGDLSGAEADLDAILGKEETAGFARARYGKGLLRAQQNRFEEALAEFSRALEADPKLAVAWFDRGRLHLGRGAIEPAEADFRRAVEQDPSGQESALLYLWAARVRRGDLAGAARGLEEYLATRRAGRPGDLFSRSAGFLLDRIGEPALLAGGEPRLHRDREARAEVHYWVALKRLAGGDRAGARDRLRRAAPYVPPGSPLAWFFKLEEAGLEKP